MGLNIKISLFSKAWNGLILLTLFAPGFKGINPCLQEHMSHSCKFSGFYLGDTSL
jgi:hypothetical protein